jgi:hypothetical protein
MDNTSEVRAFYSIMLPLVRPGLAAVAIFTAIQAWKEFLFGLTMTTGGPTAPLTVGHRVPLSQRSHSPGSRWPRLARILSGRWRPRRRNHTHRRRAPREVSFQPSGAPPRRRRR